LKVDVAETFISIQGESGYAGLGCFFVRMAGCNLRCDYCDTPAALSPCNNLREIGEIAAEARSAGMPLIEITGGEPLLQPGFRELAEELLKISSATLLVETNGSLDIGIIPDAAVAIIDVKCPAGGAGNSFDMQNLTKLRPHDEMKFVLSDYSDYLWAADFVRKHDLISKVNAVHFSPVAGKLQPREPAAWIIADKLPVRLQLQLHRIIGVE